ncbi:regulatory protein MerR [Rhizobium sp. PDO1-076]|uniref:helix-turn-helix transcriptional regulator n=1 Tax=Rhizobium sp. PDO1-076 TaxID=1125979 RepID=UPI00024E2CA5|nr:hypothetical protein [Rhizobium sp. PDO1-076]EHS53012.1 regulatory protein MerR [Rhizobium sp. PDO1-076]
MAKAINGSRPPSFVSIATLARELDMSESNVRSMVKRGTLPPPIQLSTGTVRWKWSDIQGLMGGEGSSSQVPKADPYMLGALNATKA